MGHESSRRERGVKPDPALMVQGISHINIVVDDIEGATVFYHRTLGFEIASNPRRVMDYRDVTMEAFARNAGFLDQDIRLDIRFLVHPAVGLYLELMRYHEPRGDQTITVKKTNDLGGIRHVAFAVSDATAMYEYLREQPGVQMINPSPEYGPPQSLVSGIKFFYWLDPWGVQWEMEEGRSIGSIRGIRVD